MKRSNTSIIRSLARPLPVPIAVAGMLAFAPAVADEAAKVVEESASLHVAEEQAQGGPGPAANMHFTDEDGNRREPTAGEIREAAEAFRRDLARLARGQKGDYRLQTLPDGTVRATVAPSKLVFLNVRQTEDGELEFGHSTMDEDGNVSFEPASALPEK